jgi:hypothetical protein
MPSSFEPKIDTDPFHPSEEIPKEILSPLTSLHALLLEQTKKDKNLLDLSSIEEVHLAQADLNHYRTVTLAAAYIRLAAFLMRKPADAEEEWRQIRVGQDHIKHLESKGLEFLKIKNSAKDQADLVSRFEEAMKTTERLQNLRMNLNLKASGAIVDVKEK